MAQISGSTSDKMYALKEFLGLNEAVDGDTKLKLGEAVACRNWRVTDDRNLERRPGLTTIETLDDEPVNGLWVGYVAGSERMIAACNGKLYLLYNSTGTFVRTQIGSVNTSGRVYMFGFGGKVYILDGSDYQVWDGTEAASSVTSVAGYVPLVAVAIGPSESADAGGELLEQVNKLSLKRRAWLSPDGSHAAFTLPEQNMAGIDYVKDLATGLNVNNYTVDPETGTLTFSSVPPAATNSYEVCWTMPASASLRSQVTAMRFAEMYSGAADNRVFLYGDGSNELFYSDMDYDGKPRADYFPDLNEIAVGDENTPVTGAIRHFSRLIVFKYDSTWVISQDVITLENNTITAAFYCTSVNKSIGNRAPGQVMLVDNSPRSLFADDLYEWHNASAYGANLTVDERQAKNISGRVRNTLRSFSFQHTVCWDNNDTHEYYICYNGTALVHNYDCDAWYAFTNFDARCFANLNGELYIGDSDGRVKKLDSTAMSDDGVAIDAYWESGSISYNMEWARKYSSTLWISIKPQTSSYVEITAITDRKTENAVKTIATGSGGFATWDFSSFNFADFEMPQVERIRIKVKKFTFYKLIFKNDKADTLATVLSASMRVRQTGYVK